MPQRTQLLREVRQKTSPSATTRSGNSIQNASLLSSTRRRSRLEDESPSVRITRQKHQLDGQLFDEEPKSAKISPNRRRHRSLAKPFVDPGKIEDTATLSEEKVTPVKNITPRPGRRRSGSFSASEHIELALDHLITSDDKKRVDTDTEATSSEAERKEHIGKSPFSNVNFFQSASPDLKQAVRREKRKRQHDDETQSSRKKRELDDSFKRESFTTPTKSLHIETKAENIDSRSNHHENNDYTFHTATGGATPKRVIEPKQPPNTDPIKSSARSNDFVNTTYSVGKKLPGLIQTPGAGRKVSFMPGFDQLNVSKEFSQQLIKSTPIKFEKNVTKPEKTEHFEEKNSPTTDDDEIELSDDKESSSEESSVGDDDSVKDEDENNDQSQTEPIKVSLFQGVTVLVVFLLGTALARWLIIERINAGYCDVGFVNWTPHYSHFTPTEFRDYFDPEYIRDRGSQILDYIRPDCQTCPAHAKCYKGFKAVCDPGFIKKQSLLGRFLPIRPTCEPDTQKHRRVKAISNKALEILAQRNVDYQCGLYKGKNSIDAGELRDAIYKLTSANIDEDEFRDLWNSAVVDIENHNDITVSTATLAITVVSFFFFFFFGDTQNFTCF